MANDSISDQVAERATIGIDWKFSDNAEFSIDADGNTIKTLCLYII